MTADEARHRAIEIEHAIHRNEIDNARLAEAVRARFSGELEMSGIDAAECAAIRAHMIETADTLKADRDAGRVSSKLN